VHLSVLRPLDGSPALLDAAARWPIAVVSNKQGPILRREAEHLGWTRRFRALLGAGDCAADKPDPAPMRAALASVGAASGPDVWYIGDTHLDMEAARRAGVSAVLLGDAVHDGGIPDGLCDARFADGHALAAYLCRLDKGG
jgi:phosphoglycolate phosphatase